MSNLGLGLGLHKHSKILSSAFSPLDISDLELWLDSSQGITLDASNVDQWDDFSGNNNHFLKIASDTTRPTLVASILNGKPIVRFDESLSQRLLKTGGFGLTSEYDVFIVAKGVDAGSPPYGYMMCTGASSSDIVLGAPSSTLWNHWDGGDITDAATDSVWHIGEFSKNATTKSLIIDTGTPVTAANSAGVWTGKTVYIGQNNLSATSAFNGDIAAILAFSRELNPTERADLYSYLASRFAL